jgi:hypothetical protein
MDFRPIETNFRKFLGNCPRKKLWRRTVQRKLPDSSIVAADQVYFTTSSMVVMPS